MPYYVYQIKPFAQLKCLAEFDAFKPASLHAKTLRLATPPEPGVTIRVMFADTRLAAEDLLLQVREARPTGEE